MLALPTVNWYIRVSKEKTTLAHSICTHLEFGTHTVSVFLISLGGMAAKLKK